MKYRNGREAKEGDTVLARLMRLRSNPITAGVLSGVSAEGTANLTYLLMDTPTSSQVNVADCIHVEDAYDAVLLQMVDASEIDARKIGIYGKPITSAAEMPRGTVQP